MKIPTPIRRVVVLIVGGTVLLTGLVMLVTPGPGLVVILVGLATLASEFPWARKLLTRSQTGAKAAPGRRSRLCGVHACGNRGSARSLRQPCRSVLPDGGNAAGDARCPADGRDR